MNRFSSRLAVVTSSAALLFFAAPAFAAPSISSVTPVTATAGMHTTFRATVSSSAPIESCNLYVDLNDKGAMTINGNTASLAYTFPYGGARIAFVFCRDTAGGLNSGPNTSVWVEGALQNAAPLSGSDSGSMQSENQAITEQPQVEATSTLQTPIAVTAAASSSQLVKLACPTGAEPEDPCKAVYYVDAEGSRHAFPNEHVYFGWYSDFSQVKEVSSEEIASFTLGQNVAYRPGERLVKFTTDPKVYAVGARGELRWVSSETVAQDLYGADWNKKVDDIPDAFYTDYSFGTEIGAPTDFSPTTEMEDVADIETNLR